MVQTVATLLLLAVMTLFIYIYISLGTCHGEISSREKGSLYLYLYPNSSLYAKD